MTDLSKKSRYLLKKECQNADIPWPGTKAKAIEKLQTRKRTRDEYFLDGWDQYGHYLGEINASQSHYMFELSYSCLMDIESTVVNVDYPSIPWIPWAPRVKKKFFSFSRTFTF